MTRRVLYLSVGNRVNGALESLLALARGLPADNYDVCIAASKPALVEGLIAGSGIRVREAGWRPFGPLRASYDMEMARLPDWRRAAAVGAAAARQALYYPDQKRLLRRLRDEFHPDIVHINGESLLAAGAAARALGLPLVWHVRAELSRSAWGRLSGRLIPRLADTVAVVSEGLAQQLDRSRGNIAVVHDGFNLARFDPSISGAAARAEWGIPFDAPLVGFTGRLDPSKGIFDFIEAARIILSSAPKTHFLLVGAGTPEFEAQLCGRIGTLGLRERVHLTGQRSDVPALLAAMDVFVQPSWSEGLGRVLVEAMAMEKAVVATRLDAVLDLVVPEQNGLFVAPRQPEEIAAAALRFLRNRELARACGRRARADVLVRYDLRAYHQCMLRLYDSLLEPAGH